MKNSDDQFIRFNADHTTVTDGQTELNCRGYMMLSLQHTSNETATSRNSADKVS